MLIKTHGKAGSFISLKQFLAKACLRVFALVFTQLDYPRDWIRVRCLKRASRVKGEWQGYFQPLCRNRIAVLVLYPDGISDFSALNLAKAFCENDFFVLAVSNKVPSMALREKLLPLCSHLLARENQGRDFGAFQHGIAWLEAREWFSRAGYLVLANDSMYYPARFDQTIRQMIAKSDAFQCLFESWQVKHHAQSFYLQFDASVFRSDAFRRFWRNYFPGNARLHAIFHGEIAFSRQMEKEGFIPVAFYSAKHIMQTLDASLAGSSEQRSSALGILRIFCMRFHPAWAPISELKAHLPKVLSLLDQMLHAWNPSHAAGLMVNSLYSGPFKKDLCYRRTCSAKQLLDSLQGFSKQEKSMIQKDIEKRGYGEKKRFSMRYLFYASGIV